MLRWERSDGWPRSMARLAALGSLLGLAGVTAALSTGARVPSGWWALATLPLALAGVLALWRRGVTLDRETGELVHWYGLASPWGALELRRLQSRSIAGYDRVTVEAREEHFKRWPQMYAVVLRRGEGLERLVLDDEYARPEPAREAAERVARFLEVQWVS